MTPLLRSRGPAAAVAPALAAVAAGVVLAGCGTGQPQAPLADAKKLDVATSGISSSCGYSYQITAFPGNHAAAIANLESTASSFARKLAVVYHRNPEWVYQGATLAQVVTESESMLKECGLPQAAAALRAAASR